MRLTAHGWPRRSPRAERPAARGRLGCGDGRILIAAPKKGVRAVGFDIDPGRVAESRENVARAGVESLVTIERA